MPYKIRHLPHSKKVRVYNAKTGRVTAKKTTIERAKKQIKLLNVKNHEKYI